MSDKLIIFDTTLRDGEQSPGATMTHSEKMEIATLLDEMGVDVSGIAQTLSSVGAKADQIGRSGEAGRTGADDRHPAQRLLELGWCDLEARGVIADEALKPADRDRVDLLGQDALGLALALLRADAAAD